MNKASGCDGIPVELFQILKDDAVNSVGEGEGGMIWENGIETCILSCEKRSSSLCSMLGAGAWG